MIGIVLAAGVGVATGATVGGAGGVVGDGVAVGGAARLISRPATRPKMISRIAMAIKPVIGLGVEDGRCVLT